MKATGLVLLLLLAASALGLCVMKNTWGANDPIPAAQWIQDRLPLAPALDSCDGSVCDCGTQGRLSLLFQDKNTGQLEFFGVHVVNASLRPEGSFTVQDLEDQYEYITQPSVAAAGYDAYLDFNLAMYVPDLTRYQLVFADDLTTHWLYEWTYLDSTYYSLIFLVPGTSAVMELISSVINESLAANSAMGGIVEFPFPRSLIGVNGWIDEVSMSYEMFPVQVSRGTSDIATDVDFYVNVMGANLTSREVYSDPEGFDVEVAVLDFCGDLLIQLVERPSSNTSFSLSLSEFRIYLNEINSIYFGITDICGLDRWVDFHFAVVPLPMDELEEKLLATDTRFIVFAPLNVEFDEYSSYCTMYLADPSGFAIQAGGVYLDCPAGAGEFGTSPLCTVGNCTDSEWPGDYWINIFT